MQGEVTRCPVIRRGLCRMAMMNVSCDYERVVPLPAETQMFACEVKIDTAKTATKECQDRAIWKERSQAVLAYRFEILAGLVSAGEVATGKT